MKVDSDTSLQIKLLRVFSITFMCFVHVNPGLDSVSDTLSPVVLACKHFFADILGRGSVPTLTIVSGYLFARAIGKAHWQVLLRKRVSSLVIPMVVWNGIAITLGLAIFLTLGQSNAFYRSIVDSNGWQIFLFQLFGLNGQSAQASHLFLRDLFAISLIALPILNRLKPTLLGKLVILAFLITIELSPFVLRQEIAIFFWVGVIISPCSTLLPRAFYHLKWALVMASVALIYCVIVGGTWYEDFWQGLVGRLLLALSFMSLSGWVAVHLKEVGWVEAWARIESRIYFVFLSHNVVFLLFWGLWQQIFGNELSYPYLIFYISAPFLWVITSFWVWQGIRRLPTGLYVYLLGK